MPQRKHLASRKDVSLKVNKNDNKMIIIESYLLPWEARSVLALLFRWVLQLSLSQQLPGRPTLLHRDKECKISIIVLPMQVNP